MTRPSRRQIVFNWLMDKPDFATRQDGFWADSEDVLKIDALLAALEPFENNADLEASDIRLRARIGQLETAIRLISEHNHPPNDKWGNRTIWTAGCPACNPVETVTAALLSRNSEEEIKEKKP